MAKPPPSTEQSTFGGLPSNQISVQERRVTKKVDLKEGDKVGKYTVIDVIAPDSGINNIYVVQHNETQDVHCLKIEARHEKVLRTELYILLQMKKNADSKHFCKVFDRGMEKEFNWIVISLAGESLKALRHQMPDRKFSLGTGIGIAKQSLKALEELHRVGFVHRDVSPSNFAIGRPEFTEDRILYLLDFGYSHQYKESDGTLKRPRCKPTKYFGSARHAPRGAFLNIEMSRADDLESWFYMVVECLKGGLPWTHLRDPGAIYRQQRRCREGLDMRNLLGGLPVEFGQMMKIIDRLTFFDNLDYAAALQTLLDRAMTRGNVKEFPYDWENREGAAAAEGKAASAKSKKEENQPPPKKASAKE